MTRPVFCMEGQRFGRLVVGSEIITWRNKLHLQCTCDCGAVIYCTRNRLVSGNTRSCGCLKREREVKPRVDKVGNRYGRLVVIEWAGRAKWLCQCDCGNTKITTTGKLQSNHTKSCGCLLHDTTRADLSGVRYGRLTILEHVGPKKSRCRCDCGKEGVYFTGALKKGNTQSCGCLSLAQKSERMTKNHLENKHWEQLYNLKWHIIINGEYIKLRSSYELLYAEYLIANGIKFEYEPRSFNLPNGQRYVPDFYLPDEDRWVETKGHMHDKAQIKIDLFKAMGYNLTVIDTSAIKQFLPTGISYQTYVKRWKQKHNLALATANSNTIYGGQSLAA